MRTPRATYRLQFHERFRLKDALALVPYFHALGVSHIYASPLFQASPHSQHGYDVCDFSRINEEIGSEHDLAQLAEALHAQGMGLVLDIVPNHMGVGLPGNHWWWDVLKRGRASAFADCFDINWNPPDPRLKGKVLAPILGDELAKVLARGEFQIGERNGEPILSYFEHRLPLADGSFPEKQALEKANANPARLAEIINRQHYLPAHYREGDLSLNYRRFFAVNTLAGVRVEEATVFDQVHGLVERWLARGWIDGLRVDHPDGLRDPEAYLKRLRNRGTDAWIVVEKILQAGEDLPACWPVQGTTGYDFLNQLNGLFVDSANEAEFTGFYSEFTGQPVDFPKLVQGKKALVLNTLFRTEIKRLAHLLVPALEDNPPKLQFTCDQVSEGLVALASAFPVYRTYLCPGKKRPDVHDAAIIQEAILTTTRHCPELDPALIEWLGGILLLESPSKNETEFICRFQQLTGPAMAKGVEDTAFYCFNRFVSLNEVGGDPGKFGRGLDKFHADCQARAAHWPDAMLASSTHDTKRGEDGRARLNVLSEIPGQWFDAVRTWSAMNENQRSNGFSDRNAEYLFYQTLVAAWPVSIHRMTSHMEKAAREAKQHTLWEKPDAHYESSLKQFITFAMQNAEFIAQVETLVASLSEAASINSLAQTLLKLTAPGVPDIYQGSELENLSLVDPDNRRPVNYEVRIKLLTEAQTMSAAEVWKKREVGLAKLWLIWKTLDLRARHPGLFHGRSTYEALPDHGKKSGQVVAFARGNQAVTIVPRLPWSLRDGWGDTTLALPDGEWQSVFTGEIFEAKAAAMADVLAQFPVALLTRKEFLS